MTEFTTQHGTLTAEGEQVAAHLDEMLASAGEDVQAINALPGHAKSWYVHVHKMRSATPAEWMEANTYATGAVYSQLQAQAARAATTEALQAQREQVDNEVAAALKTLTNEVKALSQRLEQVETAKSAGPDDEDEDEDEDEDDEVVEEAVKPKKAGK